MGIDRIHQMLSQFGYGKSTGIDLLEEYNGLLPDRARNSVCTSAHGIRAIRCRSASAGYWLATPIQMVKALDALINNGRVVTPHLLYATRKGNRSRAGSLRRRRCRSPMRIRLTGRWYAARCSAWPTRQTAPAINIFTLRLTASRQKRHLAGFQPEAEPDLQCEADPRAVARSCVLHRFRALRKAARGDRGDPGERRRRRRVGGAGSAEYPRPHFPARRAGKCEGG